MGVGSRDVAMCLTMGPIADRTNDRLGASDLAIVELQRQMPAPATGHASRALASSASMQPSNHGRPPTMALSLTITSRGHVGRPTRVAPSSHMRPMSSMSASRMLHCSARSRVSLWSKVIAS